MYILDSWFKSKLNVVLNQNVGGIKRVFLCILLWYLSVFLQVKLEPGLLQEIPRQALGPLKVEIQDTLLDSGEGINLKLEIIPVTFGKKTVSSLLMKNYILI